MGLTILVQHEDTGQRKQACAALVAAGFTVIAADDSDAALELLAQRKVDAIVTGVTLSGLDGLGFIEAVRQQSALRAVPILVLSAQAMPDLKIRARHAGASSWLPHPFDPQRLIDTVIAMTG